MAPDRGGSLCLEVPVEVVAHLRSDLAAPFAMSFDWVDRVVHGRLFRVLRPATCSDLLQGIRPIRTDIGFNLVPGTTSSTKTTALALAVCGRLRERAHRPRTIVSDSSGDASRARVAESRPVVSSRLAAGREAVAYCFTPRNLRRTVRIALIVGVLLTAINQGAVITAGHATAATWVRSGLNFIVPFLVSNAGLLSGRLPESRSGGPGPEENA